MQPIKDPQGEKKGKKFASKEKTTIKDVERCLGCIKQGGPFYNNQVVCRVYVILNVVIACCIMHNMIIEDEIENCFRAYACS